ncbi:MAG: cysteine--tRNA ligase [Bacilli bacterium]
MENKLYIYNVMTRKKELFEPTEAGKIKMYACGITVSKDAHIGHAYQAIVFDMITKYFKCLNYDVTYVRNYTDVDDKIIYNAKLINVDPKQYASKLIEKTNGEMDKLNIDRPTVQAKATENIDAIIDFILKLIKKQVAYQTECGDVYFRVSMYKDYGKLSHNKFEDNLSGVRKNVEPGKEADTDFALWKSAKPGEIYWESPFGKGRPGWHIECSTMSMKYLGETIDIHGGGRDLIFPHHENEIAQSESLTGKEFAKYWIHNGLVKINGEKMSKSLNNTILIEDLLKQYNNEVIRFTLLRNSYTSDINITDGLFEEGEKHLYKFYSILNNNNKNSDHDLTVKWVNNLKKEEMAAMNDNFNSSLAISILFNYFTELENNITNFDFDLVKKSLRDIYYPLGLFQTDTVLDEIKQKYLKNVDTNVVEAQIVKRKIAKENKDYVLADSIRDELLKLGVVIKDTRKGTTWDININ